MKDASGQYYIGLDVGTDSVGYAVTDASYDLKKHKSEPMWGVHLFDEAKLNAERRSFRTARRRLDRRQQRIRLLQSLFAHEVAKVDANFFVRIKESALYPEDTTCGASLFADKGFTDKEYVKQYPTIHHLIKELIVNDQPHDVRLVYLACAWLVAHRGHFLNELSKDNLQAVLDFDSVYDELMDYFEDDMPWTCDNITEFGTILKRKESLTRKYKALCQLLYGTPKAPKKEDDSIDAELLLKLLCGSTVSVEKLFKNEMYSELGSLSLDKSDDELASVLSDLGDDAELVLRAKALFDWAVLNDVLQGETYISVAKIQVYEQHKEDLAALKYFIKKYVPNKYSEMFRRPADGKANYEAYAKGNSGKQEEFCKYVRSLLKGVSPDESDSERFAAFMERVENNRLCPKQVNSDNRVIPYQVYWIELRAILDNASRYLPFLIEQENGISVADKIESIFEFRVPYFVGPLNDAGPYAWIRRKADGAIYPWNFEEQVDLEDSEQAFIDRMTNTCTYLPDADVLPKMSLCYERFQMLNELNPLSVNGRRIPVEVKQQLFEYLLQYPKKLTIKVIRDFLLSNGYTKDELDTLSGVDETIKSTLYAHKKFEKLLASGQLSKSDVERIIERRTYTESKQRFSLWLKREFPSLSDADHRYVCGLKFRDFGRLSRRFLCELYGVERGEGTGEAATIMERMWSQNVTLMELLSAQYTYMEQVEEIRSTYFAAHPKTLDERLDEMRVSNTVKRPILRALDIVADVVKVEKAAPAKIFIEMARGGDPKEKGKRTISRYQRILDLYAQCDAEDVRVLQAELEQKGDAENRLQSDKLYLYYMQLGRCMYTGERIELSQLSEKQYDIDHIYPRSKVKDDSVLNNKVLVLSSVNGEKGDAYPIKSDIRHEMAGWWRFLKETGLITEEKYKRLTRNTPFSESEQWGFINRQLVETRQSTKVLATLLAERYPTAEIVYVKAGMVSEFRQEFDMLKSRSVNDLHHAKDAYLNIVVGNVYSEQFTEQWFKAHREEYNIKISTLFGRTIYGRQGAVVWNGSKDIGRIQNVVRKKNAVHLTQYAYCRKGGFFNQQPLAAAPHLIPRKKDLPTEKYGGYGSPTVTGFLLAKYSVGKKTDMMLVPVDLLYAQGVFENAATAQKYVTDKIGEIIGKEVSDVLLPLGLRIIKIGTMFEFDGKFRAYLRGKAGSTMVSMALMTPLCIGYVWEKYVKRLERFCEKKKDNPNLVYSEARDGITVEQNVELYDLLAVKLSTATYAKIPANPIGILMKGRDVFCALNVFEQAACLLQIIGVFGRAKSSDLQLIKGSAHAAIFTLNLSLSNWKKNYADVRIVDSSASGLYEAKSDDNLLDLL